MDAWNKLKLPQVAKDAKTLASFHGSHIDGIVCVKQIDFGSARTLKKNFIKMSSDFNFNVTS